MSDDKQRKNWLTICHDTSRLMRGIASELSFVASRLAYSSPESKAVAALADAAVSLEYQAELLSGAVGQKLTDDLRQAQGSSATMLKACLAGALASPSRAILDSLPSEKENQ